MGAANGCRNIQLGEIVAMEDDVADAPEAPVWGRGESIRPFPCSMASLEVSPLPPPLFDGEAGEATDGVVVAEGTSFGVLDTWPRSVSSSRKREAS